MATRTRLSDGQEKIALEETIHGLKLGLDERFAFVKQFWNSSPPVSIDKAYAFIREQARKVETDLVKERQARRALEMEAREESNETQSKRVRPDSNAKPYSGVSAGGFQFNGNKNRFYRNRQTFFITDEGENDEYEEYEQHDEFPQLNSTPVFHTLCQNSFMKVRPCVIVDRVAYFEDCILSSLQMQQPQ